MYTVELLVICAIDDSLSFYCIVPINSKMKLSINSVNLDWSSFGFRYDFITHSYNVSRSHQESTYPEQDSPKNSTDEK